MSEVTKKDKQPTRNETNNVEEPMVKLKKDARRRGKETKNLRNHEHEEGIRKEKTTFTK